MDLHRVFTSPIARRGVPRTVIAVGRDGWPPPPVGAPHPPGSRRHYPWRITRAARHRGARHCRPVTVRTPVSRCASAPTHHAMPCHMAHYPGGAMVGGRASRLAPYRHYTCAFSPPHPAIPFRPRPVAARTAHVPRVVRTRPPKNLCAPIHPAQKLLCPFVLKIRTTTGRAHYPGGEMVGVRASRLAPYRHYTRAYCPSGLPTCLRWFTACPRWFTTGCRGSPLAVAARHRIKTAATIGMIAAVRTEKSVRCPYK